ncbi:MAG: YbjN domain-containing protein [Myxococcota bacterium]
MSTELNRVIAMIEKWMGEAELDPETLLLPLEDDEDTGRTWALKHGSAHVVINVQADEDDELAFLHIYAPILDVPADNREAFYRHLLERNFDSLTSCAFAIDEAEQVVITADRSTAGLSVDEFDELISYLSSFADYYDNVLADAFGATMLGESDEE